MLRPSYSDLMETIKQGENLDQRITSRYTVVMAAAKRARQITEKSSEPLTYAPIDRAVSIAVKEMEEGKLRVNVIGSVEDDKYAKLLNDHRRFGAISATSPDDLNEDLKDDYSSIAYSTDDDDGFEKDVSNITDDVFDDEEENESTLIKDELDEFDVPTDDEEFDE